MGNKKIDEALGIDNVQELLKDLDIEKEVNDLTEIESQMKENVDIIDSQIQQYNETGLKSINVTELNSSLNEIKDLIMISKDTIQKVYDSIADSELIDSELVGSLSKLIESSHLAVKEYVDIFKDRVAFYDKVRLEAIKNQYKIQQMDHKHELDMQKLEKTSKKDAMPMNSQMAAFSQEEIIKNLED